MTTTAKTAVVSIFAQFVQGDIKGGAHAHAFRISTMRAAFEQMFKGNYSPITEAAALTEGKAKKTRAYAAGFASLGVIGTDCKKVDYKGKLDSTDNKLARDQIASLTEVTTNAFFKAFDTVMAEKPVKKESAPSAPSAPVADAAPTTEGDDAPVVDADTLRHNMAVEQDDAVCKIVALLNLGMLTGQQSDLITEALAAHAKRAVPVAETA